MRRLFLPGGCCLYLVRRGIRRKLARGFHVCVQGSPISSRSSPGRSAPKRRSRRVLLWGSTAHRRRAFSVSPSGNARALRSRPTIHNSEDFQHMPAQNRYDVVVIGAGQAGLAIGYHLAQQGRHFLILDSSDCRRRLADRWDSLTLFTPRATTACPGSSSRRSRRLSQPRRGDRVPRELRRALRPAVALGNEVVRRQRGRRSVSSSRTGRSRPTRSSSRPGPSRCRASRVRGRPRPEWFRRTAPATAARAICPGAVLVVGGGNTGFQIAQELAATRETHLASARARRRCRSGCSGATCSGGSPSPASSTSASTRGLAGA